MKWWRRLFLTRCPLQRDGRLGKRRHRLEAIGWIDKGPAILDSRKGPWPIAALRCECGASWMQVLR